MADEAANGPPAELSQLPLRPSSATAGADQPTIATTFHQFAFLPEEIRRLIWQYACIPTRMHLLQFPRYCTLRGVGRLTDPAEAPNLSYDGVRDDLAMLIADSENFQQQWNVPGCHKFRRFFWRRDLNGLSAVCPESREIYFDLAKHVLQSRLTMKKGVHVNESLDIFQLSDRSWYQCSRSFLLNLRPRLCPINFAINVDLRSPQRNFRMSKDGLTASYSCPSWLEKAIEWGREAKEGYGNSPETSLTPSIADVMIDLQNLQSVFLVVPEIKLRRQNQDQASEQTSTSRESSSRPALTDSLPLAHQYNILAHGMRDNFYGLSPGNEEVMKNWDVPAHVWPILEEMKRHFASSDNWKVTFYLMASVSKKQR